MDYIIEDYLKNHSNLILVKKKWPKKQLMKKRLFRIDRLKIIEMDQNNFHKNAGA